MTRIWWVRHGPTHQTTFTGWRDVPADLSDTAALARLDAYLPAGAHLISSDLTRAVASADALAAGRQRLPHDPDLREFNFGDWDGRHWRDIAEEAPALSRLFWEAPGPHRPPGGESWNDVAARVNAAVDRARRAVATDDLIIVAHFGAILTHLGGAGGLGAVGALAHRIEPLSVSRIDFDGGTWRVNSINHTP